MLVARVAVVLVAALACVVAWRTGGGAEGAARPPRPDPLLPEVGARLAPRATSDGTDDDVPADPVARHAGGATSGSEGYEVALRLVDIASQARVEAPSAALGEKLLRAHWRKMRPPWSPVTGPAARLVTSIALRTSTVETQWSMPTSAGKAWTPDAKVWNMNEGSFDQRDALVATPPSSFTFRIAVPQGAKLTFSEGSLNAMREASLFVVTVVDAKGAAHEVHRHRLPPASARRWTDASCSLEAFAGQTVELRLSTEGVAATSEEKLAAARQREAVHRAEADAGTPGRAGAPDAAAATTVATEADGGPPKEDPLATPGFGIALWGSPTLLARTVPRVPYNVVWIVVDALRPDVIASFHDGAEDAAKLAAPSPPLEALLPKVPGLTPAIDDLAKRGVRFTHAYSGASWTRPGTLAMLAGARSSELGLDTQQWVLQQADTARFYASDPPLLPLMARRHGVSTHAFVNNYFMVGYAPVGVDMGFEHVADHRYRTRDTLEITRDATAWLRKHRDTRFMLFVNYNSPHEPYEPPPGLLERVPPPPAGPADKTARLYMAEAAKDDEAIGMLMQTLSETGLRERTIVVLTADHGETMSSAHAGTSGLDRMPIRYHHAVSNFEETTHVPILVVAPGLLPEDRAVEARVRSIDLAPTVAELLGLEAHPRFSGRSMVSLAKGRKESDERVVVTEGRGTRAIMHGRYRLLVREGLARVTILTDRTVTANEELYDLVDDPGERHDLAPSRPELVAEMRARLVAALKNAPVAGSAAATASSAESGTPPTLHLRFAGGGRARRVSGAITVGDATTKARSFTIQPVEVGLDSLRFAGEKATLALTTSAVAPVGFDIVVDPPATPVTWELYLDDQPWPDDGVFGGPYGLLAPVLRAGMTTDEARVVAQSTLLPPIDARRDVGLFVVRERRGELDGTREDDAEGAEETARLLREWGYAHGSGAAPK
jgi:arylsulfatase A-like enzyme